MLDFLLGLTHELGLSVLHAEAGNLLKLLRLLQPEVLQVALDLRGLFLFGREVALTAFEVSGAFIEVFLAVRETPLGSLHLTAAFSKLAFGFLDSRFTTRYGALGFLTGLSDHSPLLGAGVLDHFRGLVLRCLHAIAGDVTPDEKEA